MLAAIVGVLEIETWRSSRVQGVPTPQLAMSDALHSVILFHSDPKSTRTPASLLHRIARYTSRPSCRKAPIRRLVQVGFVGREKRHRARLCREPTHKSCGDTRQDIGT